MVSLKSDGVRFLLLLLELNGEPRAIFINRSLDMYETEVWGAESYFKEGTLFDGELVWEQQYGALTQLYVIFDVIAARERLIAKTFSERLTRIHRHVLSDLPAGLTAQSNDVEAFILDEDRVFLAAHNMRMAPKKFVALHDGLALWNMRLSCSHKNDGLIIMGDKPVQRGTDRTCFKWKPATSITVDLVTNSSGGVFLQQKGQLTRVSQIALYDKKLKVRVERNELMECLGSTDAVLECFCNINGDTVVFLPSKCRTDKPTANDFTTVVKTLENVVEAITIEQLFKLSDCSAVSVSASSSAPTIEDTHGVECAGLPDDPGPVRQSTRKGKRDNGEKNGNELPRKSTRGSTQKEVKV